MADFSLLSLSVGASLEEALRCLDRSGKGIVVILGADRRLICTITDGDLRRAVLDGMNLSSLVQDWLDLRRSRTNHIAPITARAGMSRVELLKLMKSSSVRHIPLIDDDGCVVDVAMLAD